MIMGFPIIFSIVMSFQKYTMETLISKNPQWIWFENYTAVFTNPVFLSALSHSLVFTFFSILFQFLIGLVLALLFSKAFPFHNVMRGLLLSGWQIPSVVTGMLFLWLFNLDYGMVNFILTSLHIVAEPVAWLFHPTPPSRPSSLPISGSGFRSIPSFSARAFPASRKMSTKRRPSTAPRDGKSSITSRSRCSGRRFSRSSCSGLSTPCACLI